MSQSDLSLYDKVQATAATLREMTDCKPVIGVVLGSGLGAFAESLEDKKYVKYGELEHVAQSTVPGHAGQLVSGTISGVEIVVLSGRSHFYEGHSLSELTIPVRALVALGCKAIVVTNAAGGISTEYVPGDLMSIADHLNLQWVNPLRGATDERLGERFMDMSHAYDRKLRKQLHALAKKLKVPMHSGVYACVSGPSYETPAEIRMLRTMGADAVGMSTVHEVIAARHAGARVVGLSLISNRAAGIEEATLSHEEVTATAGRVAERTVELLKAFIPKAAKEVARD
ncbi:MAG: purine-nucleoside phosphorylase [Myxococcota bacterium]|jgi:purine-nucleoside phosphorylase